MSNSKYLVPELSITILSLLLSTGCQTDVQTVPADVSPVNAEAKPKPAAPPRIVSGVETNSENPLDDADAVYEGNENIPEGVYIYRDLVFVVAAVDLSKTYQIEPEGVAMLRENRLLRSRFKLPERFSVNRNQIQNGEDDDGKYYRYVTAYRLKDIENISRGNAANR